MQLIIHKLHEHKILEKECVFTHNLLIIIELCLL